MTPEEITEMRDLVAQPLALIAFGPLDQAGQLRAILSRCLDEIERLRALLVLPSPIVSHDIGYRAGLEAAAKEVDDLSNAEYFSRRQIAAAIRALGEEKHGE